MSKRFIMNYATSTYCNEIETDSIKEMFLFVEGFRYRKSNGFEKYASVSVYDNQIDAFIFRKKVLSFYPEINLVDGYLTRYQRYYLKKQRELQQDAIDWQYEVWSNEETSFEELQEGYERFKKLGKRFGLVQEFKENAII